MINSYSDGYVDSIKSMDLGWSSFFDGKYYQPINQDTVNKRRDTIYQASINGDIGGLTLRQFQDFVELDWVRPHGEFRTVLKMEEHFINEHREFVDANDSLSHKRLSKLLDSDSSEVVSELGDLFWFFGAFATNGAISMEESWNNRLNRDGIVNSVVKADIKSVDGLIKSGYFPRMGPFDVGENIASELLFAAGFVSVGAKILLEENNEKNNLAVDHRKQNVGLWLTNGLGLITLHAQSVGSSLTEVVQENIRKISSRVETDTVEDKTNRGISSI